MVQSQGERSLGASSTVPLQEEALLPGLQSWSLLQPAALEASTQLGCPSNAVVGPSYCHTRSREPFSFSGSQAKSQRSRKAKQFANMGETSPGASKAAISMRNTEQVSVLGWRARDRVLRLLGTHKMS